MPDREARDVLGEALRRSKHGGIRPLWADLPDDDARKEAWQREADLFIARLAEAGYRIAKTEGE